jgi:hypothetical protein
MKIILEIHLKIDLQVFKSCDNKVDNIMSKGKCDFHKRIFAWIYKGIIKGHKLVPKMMVLQMEICKSALQENR